MSTKVPSLREAYVLRLTAWGYTNKQIAARLAISVKTAETHKWNAMRKLAFRHRFEVVKYAVEHGWLVSHALPHQDEQWNEQATADASSVLSG